MLQMSGAFLKAKSAPTDFIKPLIIYVKFKISCRKVCDLACWSTKQHKATALVYFSAGFLSPFTCLPIQIMVARFLFLLLLQYDFLSGASTSAQCLLNTPTNLPVETSYVGLTYPGQIWTANDQCKQIYGQNSSFCPVGLTLNSLIVKKITYFY